MGIDPIDALNFAVAVEDIEVMPGPAAAFSRDVGAP
jgi:hypothetical protein